MPGHGDLVLKGHGVLMFELVEASGLDNCSQLVYLHVPLSLWFRS